MGNGRRTLPDQQLAVSTARPSSDDGSRCLEGVWFNQPYAAQRFRYGQRLAFAGKPKWYRDHWQMSNPRVQGMDGSAAENTPAILPIYPLTEDLRSEKLRPLIAQ